MIAYLTGTVLKKLEKSLIITQPTIGYEVFVTPNLFQETCESARLELFIHTHVREAEISLYGFQKAEELQLFRKLISINGIGPRLAMDFLSIPLAKLKAAITDSDINFITTIPGIGKKIAQRVVLELKGKITPEDLNTMSREHKNINEEVIEALNRLGYNKKEVEQILKKMPEQVIQTEEVIKFFLQNI